MTRFTILTLGLSALLGTAVASPAGALTMKECSAKYQEAKKAGGTAKWKDFRKAECGADASAAAPATAPAGTPAAPSTAAAAPDGSVPFPSAVDPKYGKLKPGKARMQTCLDAYKEAKAAGTLGGTRWIQKGGGYYHTCNARLKG